VPSFLDRITGLSAAKRARDKTPFLPRRARKDSSVSYISWFKNSHKEAQEAQRKNYFVLNDFVEKIRSHLWCGSLLFGERYGRGG
jgi:hypothetical protein